MTAGDYTTLANIKLLGPIDTANDDTLISGMISSYSRIVDEACNMEFQQLTYALRTLRPRISIDGQLTIIVPTPVLTTLTALNWKQITDQTWNPLDVTKVDIDSHVDGTIMRVLGSDFSWNRGGTRLRVQVSYQGGWVSPAGVPADFEFLVRSLVYWGYKKRDSVEEKSGTADLGEIFVKSSWPTYISQGFAPYTRRYG